MKTFPKVLSKDKAWTGTPWNLQVPRLSCDDNSKLLHLHSRSLIKYTVCSTKIEMHTSHDEMKKELANRQFHVENSEEGLLLGPHLGHRLTTPDLNTRDLPKEYLAMEYTWMLPT